LLLAAFAAVGCRNANSAAAHQDFRTAVQDEQVATVARWLDQGLDPNEQPAEDCSTPLALAVLRGNTEIARLILEHGGNINAAASPNGQTVLHCVTARDQEAPDMVGLLIENGADVNAVGGDRVTPLMQAAARGHAETVKLLLDAHPDLEAQSAAGKTAIELAAASNRAEVVSLLRLAGARMALPPPGPQEDLAGQTGLVSIATENGMIMLGETFDEAREKLESGTRLDFTQLSPVRNIEIRRFNNQTYRLTYEREGKTGPYRLIRIELQ
jgi:hypothetical protein